MSAKHTSSPLILRFRGLFFFFALTDFDAAIERLNAGIVFDNVHTSRIKNSMLCYQC